MLKTEFNIEKNIEEIKLEIINTCREINRNPNEVTIIAASKYAEPDEIVAAYRAGIKVFGENRAEDLVKKISVIKERIIWHFIGHLQSRKIKKVVPYVDCIQSVDKIETLNIINEEAKKFEKIMEVLIEVNISGEESKYGINPDGIKDIINESLSLENIKIKGLMTIAPFTKNEYIIRDVFRKLRILRDKLNANFNNINLIDLSMGMSNDYRIAIEEGSTMVRIGSLIFKQDSLGGHK